MLNTALIRGRWSATLVLVAAVAVSAPAPASAQRASARARAAAVYYPGAGEDWQRRAPAAVGMDAARLDSAIAFARANESREARDLAVAHTRGFGREPHGEPIGPFRERGDPAGIVIRNGYIVAEWGDVRRVDMTFSVTKSFLSTVVGLAIDRGLIRSVHDTVHQYMAPILALGSMGIARPVQQTPADSPREGEHLAPFATAHNRTITWDHLLRQTSDWEGTLWGKPEWADRPSRDTSTWRTRARLAPGTAYEYNDVRVNVLALAALEVWRRPLPEVLREYVMDPIGASNTWRWTGYDNSWVLIDGRAVQSVSGGGHWGGGMFISARDQARFGLLGLRRGRWRDRQILSEAWVRHALTPTTAQTDYGVMNWFLNTDRRLMPSAPATAFVHLGSGTNLVYVDPENDLVVVARWISRGAMDEFVGRVVAAVRR